MSNGNESAQSRRSARQARGVSADQQTDPQAQQAGAGTAAAQRHTRSTAGSGPGGSARDVPRERRSRRAADAPVDAPATTAPRERISQTRARDREALRTYRALSDQQAPTEQADQVSTRRQLRRQQQIALGTQGVPVVQNAHSQRQSEGHTPTASDIGGRDSEPGRHPEPDGTQPGGEATAVDLMSVEQALAAREAIIGQAENQVAMMEASRTDDPFSVDLEILAQQKALAERAAVLNTRAQKIQQLTQENQQRKPLLNDPTTAHNLSIVSPVGFVQGSGSPVDRAPVTSHIPVVTGTKPRQGGTTHGVVAPVVVPQRPAPAKPALQEPAAPEQRPVVSSQAEQVQVGQPPSALSPDSASRSRVLAQAEAMVQGQGNPGSEGATPIRARSAYGLEPLDAMTAGLARVKRMRMMQYSIVGLGALALITGIMMIAGIFN
ncbi:hypothetical protein [Arthrobacter sp. H5]|uniref:hypothetical protein n=1 Tax=Arthrobacter sp. H5 TaxID=1267973 RepID=UPI000482B09B|nr:hypothetical protein [Arthrobacter sp. H5]